MQVEIKTSDVRPIRQTFGQVARRIGGDKAASRYQEATMDMQPTANFHYRPLWQPEFALYDKARTAIQMADWYLFKDPRHYYYGAYTIARAKQQEGNDRQFEFVEKQGLLGALDEETLRSIERVLVPLRHYEWGANMNNSYCTGYGYGTAITQACMFATMDRLALAQHVSRIGLLVDGNKGAALEAGKAAWLTHPAWQGVRRVMENLFVTKDWFELYMAQNLVFDSLLLPLVNRHYVQSVSPRTGNALAMLIEFNNDWADETARWVDATIKTADQESEANARLLSTWYLVWRDEVVRAIEPVAQLALATDDGTSDVVAGLRAELDKRVAKLGLNVA